MVAASSVILFTALAAAGPVEILEFTGPGCPACVHMAPIVEQAQRAGVPIRQLDVHHHPELVQRFGITAIPAFVLVADGREVDRIVGGTTAEGLAQLYQQAVPTGSPANVSADVAPSAIVRGQDAAPGAVIQPFQQTAVGARTIANPAGSIHPEANRLVPVHENSSAKAPSATPQSAAATPAAASGSSPAARALAATVRLKVVDQGGHSYGTGTIIDVHENEALVLTCGHIFRNSQGKGPILCDLFVPGGGRDIPAKLISYDLRRDIGLVSLRPGTSVIPVPVGGLGYSPRKGDPVFAVGCNQGADPSVIENRIIDVNRYHGPPNLVVGGRPIDGRSGGGLFSADGLLIGVCNAADPELDEGLYAALGNIHAELDAANLGFVYRRSAPLPDTRAVVTTTPAAVPIPTAVANQAEPGGPSVAGNTARPATANIATTASTPSATAAGVATVHPASTPEFVYIRWSQGAEDQVYMLERPSPEFLQSLSREINRRGPHLPTASRNAMGQAP